jgi:hypothetical protein
MTWPGLSLWIPSVGLVAWLPRAHYDPSDPHAGRPAVVIKVLPVEKVCIAVTRTSAIETIGRSRGDVLHQEDPAFGCDRQGWWQARRPHRVQFSAFTDEETVRYEQKLDMKTLDAIIRAYEEQR